MTSKILHENIGALILNSLVLRQTKGSRFSHYNGSFDQLLELTTRHFQAENARPGYRDGVFLVDVPVENFFSGIVKLEDGSVLSGRFEPRRSGEEPRKFLTAVGSKIPAKSVQIVVYRGDILAENNDHCGRGTDDQFEIISINASPTDGPSPIPPETLMHNHFESSGGTNTGLSDSEFVAMLRESFIWFKDKAMAAETVEVKDAE